MNQPPLQYHASTDSGRTGPPHFGVPIDVGGSRFQSSFVAKSPGNLVGRVATGK
jgi:hypothetical protein